VEIAFLTDLHLPLPAMGPTALLRLPRRFGLCAFANKRALGLLSWALRRSRRHQPRVLEAVLADLRAAPPDLVLVGGDLCNLALPWEFERARARLAHLASIAPVLAVFGNHDAYVPGALEAHGHLWAPWTAGCVRREDWPWVHDLPERGVVVIGLSTAVPRPFGDAGGEIGTAQLARLEEALGRFAGKRLRILLLHHPPHGRMSRHKLLADRGALLALLARRGAELVLCGHLHVFETGLLPGPRGPIPLVQGPSASQLDERRPGGYVRLRLEPAAGRIAVEARLFRDGGIRSCGVEAARLPEPVRGPLRETTGS